MKRQLSRHSRNTKANKDVCIFDFHSKGEICLSKQPADSSNLILSKGQLACNDNVGIVDPPLAKKENMSLLINNGNAGLAKCSPILLLEINGD